jgi:hypothetical protein
MLGTLRWEEDTAQVLLGEQGPPEHTPRHPGGGVRGGLGAGKGSTKDKNKETAGPQTKDSEKPGRQCRRRVYLCIILLHVTIFLKCAVYMLIDDCGCIVSC